MFLDLWVMRALWKAIHPTTAVVPRTRPGRGGWSSWIQVQGQCKETEHSKVFKVIDVKFCSHHSCAL